MKDTSRIVSVLVWGGITLVIGVIAVAYVRERSQASKTLPILREVNPFSLTNQHGQVVTRESLAGKVWLAEIIFSRCPVQCLKMTRELVAIQNELPKRDDLGFVSLTADPEYDTPAVLKNYGAAHGADPARWNFLTGSKSNLYSLALDGLLLSVRENPDKQNANLDDLFIHSTRLVLVDRKGRLRAWFNGDGTTPRREIATAVGSLLQEK